MLYKSDTELLFPPRVITSLASLRGPLWRGLVQHVSALPQTHPDVLGFMLMMVRLDGCLTCHADSYRAMLGCTSCARQNVLRFKGNDQELITLWEAARQEVRRWQENGSAPLFD